MNVKWKEKYLNCPRNRSYIVYGNLENPQCYGADNQITPLDTSPITPEAWKLLSRLPSLHRIPTTINSLSLYQNKHCWMEQQW